MQYGKNIAKNSAMQFFLSKKALEFYLLTEKQQIYTRHKEKRLASF